MNGVTIYKTSVKDKWDESVYLQALLSLPESMQQRITAYQDRLDRQSRIMSKLMLRHWMAEAKLLYSLSDVKYSAEARPFVSADLDFNIAHADGIVMLAAAVGARVGVDIEAIKPVHISDYQEQLTEAELVHIRLSDDDDRTFYRIWTRKEAVIKAIGLGVHADWQQIDVLNDMVKYVDQTYYVQKIAVGEGHMAHLAINTPHMKVALREMRVFDFNGI
jgi:4'-phosphopantetheinyl transferase